MKKTRKQKNKTFKKIEKALKEQGWDLNIGISVTIEVETESDINGLNILELIGLIHRRKAVYRQGVVTEEIVLNPENIEFIEKALETFDAETKKNTHSY